MRRGKGAVRFSARGFGCALFVFPKSAREKKRGGGNAMATRHYRAISTLPVTFAWKCSSCNNVNTAATEIKTTSDASSFGGQHNEAVSQRTKDEASIKMKQLLPALSGEIKAPFESFLALGLNCKCEKCGKREAWAVSNNTAINRFFVKVGIVLIIALVFEMFLDGLIVLLPIGGLVGLFFVCKLVDSRVCASKTEQIQRLPQSSLPVMLIYGEPITNNLDYESQAFYQEIKGSKRDLFCVRCGQKLPKNSWFCPYCGKGVDKNKTPSK